MKILSYEFAQLSMMLPLTVSLFITFAQQVAESQPIVSYFRWQCNVKQNSCDFALPFFLYLS
jgi:hypothetical protein